MRISFALIGVTALAGCATNPKVQGVEPSRPPAMRVSIGFPAGRALVYPIFVNREAYVALFEIVPGRGVTLLYPQTRRQVWASDMHYADLTIQLGRTFYHSDPFGLTRRQPRYYYAIASAAPLNLTRLHASLGATRRVLGRMYASYRPYDVIDRLTELVVPRQRDEDWATDLFLDWPAVPPRAVLAQQVIRCANGRVLFVAANYPYFGCPGDTQRAVAMAPKPAVPGPKELPFEAVPRPPRGEKREPIELSAPDVGNRRRAEAGAPPPRRDPVSRGYGEGIRYSSDASSPAPRAQPHGSSTSQPRPSEGSQKVERSEPRTLPAPERSEPKVRERGGEKDPR
jgi:hypothetical protein